MRSNTPFVGSPVVDEERMRPSHRLRLLHCVSFSALKLMVGCSDIFVNDP